MNLEGFYEDRLGTYESGDYVEVFERSDIPNEAEAIVKIMSALSDHPKDLGWYLLDEPKSIKEVSGKYTIKISFAKSKSMDNIKLLK